MAVPVTSFTAGAILIVVVMCMTVSVVVTLDRDSESETVRLYVHSTADTAVEEDTPTDRSSIELVVSNVAVIKKTSFSWTVLLAY